MCSCNSSKFYCLSALGSTYLGFNNFSMVFLSTKLYHWLESEKPCESDKMGGPVHEVCNEVCQNGNNSSPIFADVFLAVIKYLPHFSIIIKLTNQFSGLCCYLSGKRINFEIAPKNELKLNLCISSILARIFKRYLTWCAMQEDPRVFYSEEILALFTPTISIGNKIIYKAHVKKL